MTIKRFVDILTIVSFGICCFAAVLGLGQVIEVTYPETPISDYLFFCSLTVTAVLLIIAGIYEAGISQGKKLEQKQRDKSAKPKSQ